MLDSTDFHGPRPSPVQPRGPSSEVVASESTPSKVIVASPSDDETILRALQRLAEEVAHLAHTNEQQIHNLRSELKQQMSAMPEDVVMHLSRVHGLDAQGSYDSGVESARLAVRDPASSQQLSRHASDNGHGEGEEDDHKQGDTEGSEGTKDPYEVIARSYLAHKPTSHDLDFTHVQTMSTRHVAGVARLLSWAPNGRQGTMTLAVAKNGRATCYGFPELPLPLDSRLLLWTSFASMLFLSYDAVTVPYVVAFEPSLEREGFLFFVRLAATCVWTLDLILSFLSHRSAGLGVVLTKFRAIAWRYLRTWFVLDATLVTLDWVDLITSAMTTGDVDDREDAAIFSSKILRVLKMGRVFQIMARLKTGRYGKIRDMLLHIAYRRGLQAQVLFMLRMAKIIVAIMWVNHAGGCAFYLIVRHGERWSDREALWPKALQDLYAVHEFSKTYLPGLLVYSASLHWSMSAMAAGASIYHPGNSLETLFTILYVVFGMFVTTSIISSFSAMLVKYQLGNHQTIETINKVQSFLRQHRATPDLSTQVMSQCVRHLGEQKDYVTISDLPILSSLSIDLREELLTSLFTPVICQHDLFRNLDYLDDLFMRDFCYNAVSWRSSKQGEFIITPGEQVLNAVLVKAGTVVYQAPGAHVRRRSLVEGMWLCEMTLWIKWEAIGRAEFERFTEVLMLHQPAMERMLRCRPQLQVIVCDYAHTFARIIAKEQPVLTDVGQLIDHDTIVSLMSLESRWRMSEPALSAMRTMKHVDRLEDELRQGTCELSVDIGGNVSRVVWVAAVSIRRWDGRKCIQLGNVEDRDRFKLTMQLPGSKIRYGEYPGDAVSRILSTDFPQVDWSSVAKKRRPDPEATSSDSGHYPQLRTKYVRTTYNVEMGMQESMLLNGTELSDSPDWDRVPGLGQLDSQMLEACEVFACINDRVYAWMEHDAVERYGGQKLVLELKETWFGEFLARLQEHAGQNQEQGTTLAAGESAQDPRDLVVLGI